MFSSFMWSMAKTMNPIEGDAEIRPDNTSDYHGMQFFTLWNEKLAKMAQDIHTAGLGSLDHIYLSIIPPLSVQQRLPRSEAIIDLRRRQARPHEQLRQWTEAGETYLWLLRTAMSFPKDLFNREGGFAASAIAVFMEYLRTVSLNFELKEAQRGEEDAETQELKHLKSCLERELEPVSGGILLSFMRLYKRRGRGWLCVPVQEARCGLGQCGSVAHQCDSEEPGWPETFRLTIHESFWSTSPKDIQIEWMDVDAKDIHNWTPLHDAAVDGEEEMVAVMLEKRGDVNARDLNEWTPLHYACRRGAIGIVQDLIRSGADPNARGRDGIAPLHNAAMNGHVDVVRSLIEAGATLDILDLSKNTPLLWAAYNGHRDVVNVLWEDTNRKLRNDNGGTALHLAAMAGREEVMTLLKSFGVDAEARDGYGRTPLHHATRNGHKDVVSLLVDNFKADKEASDRFRKRPLHLAAANGHEDTVELLVVDLDVDKEARDSDQKTPLDYAVRKGHGDVVELLVNLGADIELVGRHGSTLLYRAASDGLEAMVDLLVRLGADKDASCGALGQTPLHHAAQNGQVAIVKLLVGLGADKEARGKNGETPLQLAIEYEKEAIVELLLLRGADKEARARDGRTPLHYAAQGWQERVVALLVDHGADKEARDEHGNTPLHYAVESKSETTIRRLVDFGADVSARNNDGRTPLHFAVEKGPEAVERFLRDSLDAALAPAS
ncbi:ankyrin repeat domain-containing protein [Candidatus Bathyarchaeota archaeon]|nr:ankyrin repeat domain-containing protein [Candidatus Bathyarchaeota archaeon]